MRTKRTITAIFALLTVGLAFAAAAQAASEADLGWKVNGKALGEAETSAITGQGEGSQSFKVLLTTFECTKAEFLSAKLIGAGLFSPGKGEGKISYRGCGVAGFPSCKINGELGGGFITKPLVMTDAYLTKSAAEKEEIASGANGFVLAPKEGTTFATFVVGGASCPISEGEIPIGGTGVIVKLLKGSKETTYNEEIQTHLFQTTELTSYFENEVGKTVEHKAEMKYSGKLNVSVATGSTYNLKT
jgi:hypothetical protein